MSNLLLLATTLVIAYTVEAVNIIPRSYIIEYAPGTDHHNVLQRDLFQFQELYEIHHTYSSPIFHGMSFTLKDPPAIPKTQHKHLTPVSYSVNDKIHPVFNHISIHPAIKNIYPVYEVPRPQWIQNPKNISYTFPYANKYSQIDDIHKELGITGKGILIGVLDSGIDYHHPALGGGFGEGFKVRYGKNLVAASNDEENGLKSLGEDDPFDPCLGYDAGHGTHVSGIIAGYDKKMNFTGVAPDATLGFWRIFGCQGGAAADTVIKAMEMAYEAGCQIINLSLGIESSWPEDPMAAVAENLSKKGVIVVGVAGNQGPNGAYSQNSPASARSVISTASVDNWFYPAKVMDINIYPDSYFPFMFSSNTMSFPNGILASIVSEGTFPFGCANDTAITTEKVQGKIVIVKRGLCSFNEKLIAARTSGAIGVLFYDPEAENNALIVAKTEKDLLPCAGIEKELALRLIDYYKEPVSIVEITFPDTNRIVVPDTAGRISDFSSTGPTYELDLKPSITGIGGDVYSTLPRHIDQGFGVRSGTSMAAPHIAGCAALFLDYFSKQNLAPSFIMEHMQNHAKPVIAKSGIPEHPIVQGAGLIQPYDTMKSKVHVSPSHISFNDTASLTEYKSYTLNIINSNSVPLTVSIENIQSNSIETFANMTSFTPTEPALTNGKLKVELEFSPVSQGRTLVLSPMSTASVRVKVILPDPSEIFYHYQMYGGFISIKNTETSESLATVPYFGVLGKMVDLPLFDRGYPYLAPASNLLNRQGENVTYQYDMTHKVKTKPSIVLRLLTGSAKIEINVYDENQNDLGLLSGGPWTYNQRNTLAENNYDDPIAWNGKYIPIGKEKEIGDNSVQAKDGTYYLFLRALKHFGDPNNKKDWKEWKSGPIQVKN